MTATVVNSQRDLTSRPHQQTERQRHKKNLTSAAINMPLANITERHHQTTPPTGRTKVEKHKTDPKTPSCRR